MCFRTETGPTAWLAPVYPLIVAATFKLFGTFTARAFFACAGAEHTFFLGGLRADFLCWGNGSVDWELRRERRGFGRFFRAR